ncbi:enoyl-CoA hydratase/isomerase family protein [Skermania piniformis]|uniref:Enoyl-CoA hydratase/isomerase family protein n=1 Tax=Skermania pinensis TaxID=39122 RepID=A0ABX8S9A3_9ACTN|nr:enoyl-CoA hydratase/isomerase family protein [Skermania piniformis]QXQ14051.1 enoyl-CoA hydratase/isomerase family protein [Skermania piniformis]
MRKNSAALADTRFDRLEVTIDGTVAVVRMDGGPLGMLDRPLVADLAGLVDVADRDPAVRAVVLTGARPDRFAGHADVRWMREGSDNSPPVGRRGAVAALRFVGAAARSVRFRAAASRTVLAGVLELDRFHDTFVRMNSSSVIYLAAINGAALGGGAELAWACDIRLIADHADACLGQPEVLMGFHPGGGGTQRLTHLVGPQRALRMILDGAPIDAARALEIGAVDAVVDPADLVGEAIGWARRLAARPAAAVGAIKRAVYFAASRPLSEGLLAERSEFLQVLATPQTREIMHAYIRDYEAAGRLLLHDPEARDQALQHGHWPVAGG